MSEADRQCFEAMTKSDIEKAGTPYMHSRQFSSNTEQPLVVNDLNSNTLQLFELHTPYTIMLEVCREDEQVNNAYVFSYQNYEFVQNDASTLESVRRWPLHQHDFIEIMYVLSGSVTNHVENQIFTYEAGQCCVMNKNIRHKEEFSGNFQAVFLMFQDSFLLELLSEYQWMDKSDFIEIKENPVFQLIEDSQQEYSRYKKVYLDYFPVIPSDDILERLSPLLNNIILETLSMKPGSTFFIKGNFARIFHILNDTSLFSVNRIHSDSTSQDFLFSKISHIMQTSHGRCPREELCARLHYNADYLNRIVKKYTGKTLLEYGQSIYLEETRHLLADTDKSISDIITEFGFSNHSHFYRLFKKKYGETPLEYRNRCRYE